MLPGIESIVVELPYENAIVAMTDRFSMHGLHVLVTFDLPFTDNPGMNCTCWRHGSEECTCRMSVFLIYGLGASPISMLAHGYEDRTWLSLVDSLHQPVDSSARDKIISIMAGIFPEHTT